MLWVRVTKQVTKSNGLMRLATVFDEPIRVVFSLLLHLNDVHLRPRSAAAIPGTSTNFKALEASSLPSFTTKLAFTDSEERSVPG